MGSLRYLLLENGERLALATINENVLDSILGADVSEDVILSGRNILFDGEFSEGNILTARYTLENGNYFIKRTYPNYFYPDFKSTDLTFHKADDSQILALTNIQAVSNVSNFAFYRGTDNLLSFAYIGQYIPPLGTEGTRLLNKLTSETERTLLNEWVGDSYEQDEDNRDPFEEGGNATASGGDGNFDDSSDEIEIPELPEEHATSSGFITAFKPSLSQLNALSSFMWSGIDITAWKKIFADPIDAIIGLTSYPFNIPTGASKEIKVGGISSGIISNTAGVQYIEFNCGTIPISKYWGAYLDYSPYSKIDIYLPFIGMRTIDMDDVQDANLGVKYHIDILSGSCIAFVTSNGNVLYQFSGQAGEQIPVTSSDHNNLITNGVAIAGSVIGAVATGGSGAIIAGSALTSTAGAVMNSKPTISRTGSISGNISMMSMLTPYIIITRPSQCVASGQNHFTGYPIYATYKLSSLKGYTEIDNIHLEGINATDAELSEIEMLLKGGVIF